MKTTKIKRIIASVIAVFVVIIGNVTGVIAKAPEKIITMGPNVTEMVVALGAYESIIGTTLTNHSRGPLEEYKAIYEKLPELAFGSASRESVLASGAEYVFGIDWEFSESGLNIEELEKNGMKVFVEKAKTIDELYSEISEVSKILEREAEGEKLIAKIKEEVASVKPIQEKKKVLVFDSENNGVYTAGGTNFATRLIEAAGGTNIFDDIKDKEWSAVSYEEVLSRNPELIVVLDYDVPSSEEKIKSIKANPVLSQLDAVKNEKFLVLPLENFLPGVRMGQTVKSINEALLK
ncbi:ABC transporter substrate-binding protein [Tuanshanicoccus lijuaniae]|uniref:ABC transporter substrate-binding protein n=1 Tax=Aerococcaceae bacterium zg-1292 TaxID=2774330 RepID=UPI001936A0DC|nr:ABC transporter substrate-binding protein [Aerococcaceae bacterium zg-1292]MBF6625121.1 ABC transporter substrate-binding protein [Aerococcaceae bacterium zg-BR9]MBS4456464.1 ABC transporter substrate-binding protein [Aerococcaceae bacterium zg-A91]MBS4458314.1 ABC transporter substrate-binding protein [Aerococcaceae bacterium zg-BR33]QQA37453.1 ABC transporter substrate-binding protein [Aerococcaceae bacterium zg-1292]